MATPLTQVPSAIQSFFEATQGQPPQPGAVQGPVQVDPDLLGGGAPPAAPPTPELIPQPMAREDITQIVGEGLKDYIDPQLLQALISQAGEPKRSLADVFARTGLAITNPEMLQTIMAEEQRGQFNARSLLAQLQAQATSFRKGVLAADAASRRVQGQQVSQTIRQVLNDLPPDLQIGTPPVDVTAPDYIEKAEAWLNKAQPEVNRLRRERDRSRSIGMATAALTEAAQKGSLPTEPVAAHDYAKALYMAAGVDEKDAEVLARGPALANATKLALERKVADINRVQAETAYLGARLGYLATLRAKAQQSIKQGGLRDLLVVKGLLAQFDTEVIQAQTAMDRAENGLATGTIGQEERDRRVNMFFALQTQAMQSKQDILSLLGPNIARLDFAQRYTGIVNQTLNSIVMSDPTFAANPAIALQSIVTPGENAIKHQFWTEVLKEVRRLYGTELDFAEIVDALEQEMFTRGQTAGAAVPGQAESILSPAQEVGLYQETEPKPGAAPPAAPQSEPGILERLENLRRSVSGFFNPETPSETETPPNE